MQPSRQPGAIPQPVSMPRSEQFDCVTAAGRQHRIFIAWPPGDAPSSGFPVIYVMDANAAFGTLVEAIRVQSRHPLTTGVQPAIVVGIGYPIDEPFDVGRRSFDLTPPIPEGWPTPIDDPAQGLAVGGASATLAFLADELIPLVERRFAGDPRRRSLFGHSFGGLFVLHALFNRPDLFSHYVAASPSIWWQGRAILDQEQELPGRLARLSSGARLAITVGSLEQGHAARRPSDAGGGTLEARRMIDNARDLAWRLAQIAPDRLDVAFSILADENHGSCLPVALNRALRFIGEGQAGTVNAGEGRP